MSTLDALKEPISVLLAINSEVNRYHDEVKRAIKESGTK